MQFHSLLTIHSRVNLCNKATGVHDCMWLMCIYSKRHCVRLCVYMCASTCSCTHLDVHMLAYLSCEGLQQILVITHTKGFWRIAYWRNFPTQLLHSKFAVYCPLEHLGFTHMIWSFRKSIQENKCCIGSLIQVAVVSKEHLTSTCVIWVTTRVPRWLGRRWVSIIFSWNIIENGQGGELHSLSGVEGKYGAILRHGSWSSLEVQIRLAEVNQRMNARCWVGF